MSEALPSAAKNDPHFVASIRGNPRLEREISGGPANAVYVPQYQDLSRISASDKNILLASWVPSLDLRAAIDHARYDDLPELQMVLAKDSLSALPSLAHHPLSRALFTEILPILSAFAALLPEKKVRILLARTRGRTCPLFHIDRVTLRLLCTFRGPGTEWLADTDVSRKGLGHGDNGKVMRSRAPVYEAPLHHVCLLKGDAYKGNAGRGIVHRSPAVPGHTNGRWYLRVDPE